MLCKCENCSVEFEKLSSEIKRTKHNFCSKSCAATYNNRGKIHNPRKIKKCGQCKNDYYGPGKYCSKKCSRISLKGIKEIRKEVIKKPISTRVETKCKCCDNIILRTEYQIKRNRGHFCSKICADKHKNKDNSNITKNDLKYSTGFAHNKYVKIRIHAQKMYKQFVGIYKCAVCGYDKHVEICHKKAIKDFPDTTLLSEINSIDNLIALCPNCHWEFDNNLLSIN